MLYNSPAIPRLDIPAYNWWSECLHGVARNGIATVFPQAIGLAATFDTALLTRVAAAISDEARAKYYEAQKERIKRPVCRLILLDSQYQYFQGSEMGERTGNLRRRSLSLQEKWVLHL